MAEQRYRVTNTCHYDIGVALSNGQNVVIKAGSFQLLTADDIYYIESICTVNKFFAKRMLVPYDSTGKEVTFESLGTHIEVDENHHMDDDEIRQMLHQNVKKLEAWLNGINDEAELFAIYEIAKSIEDLPANKLRVLKAKMPDKDLIE